MMIDHEKLQKGRAWAYLAGTILALIVLAWKFVAR